LPAAASNSWHTAGLRAFGEMSRGYRRKGNLRITKNHPASGRLRGKFAERWFHGPKLVAHGNF